MNLKILLNEDNKNLMALVKDMIGINYDLDNITILDLIDMIENLVDTTEHYKKEYRLLKNDLRQNYTPISVDYYKEYGLNENDFH